MEYVAKNFMLISQSKIGYSFLERKNKILSSYNWLGKPGLLCQQNEGLSPKALSDLGRRTGKRKDGILQLQALEILSYKKKADRVKPK